MAVFRELSVHTKMTNKTSPVRGFWKRNDYGVIKTAQTERVRDKHRGQSQSDDDMIMLAAFTV